MRHFPVSTYFRVTAALFLVLFAALLTVDRPVKLEKRIVERREVQGKDAPTHWLVPVWLWRGLAANTVLAAFLVSLTPLATRRAAPRSLPSPSVTTPYSRREKWLLAASVVLLAASTAPRLGQSLWGDEEYCMKAYIAPEAEVQADGSVKLQPRPWMTTIWDYQRPTNHIGFTVVARLFHDTLFTPGSGPNDPWFSETLMRLPSFLAGLGAIFTLVWCCQVWGLRQGAAWIALGYAGHAWLVRFGCDARGYGFVVLLIPVLLATLRLATQSGLWRWWLAFAFTQFYLLWTYPGVVHVPVAANILAIALIWQHPADQRLAHGVRWLIGGVVTALLVIGVMAPCLPPFLDFLRENRLQGRLDLPWFRDTAAAMFCGALWQPFDPANPLATSLNQEPLPRLLSAAWIALGGVTALLGGLRLLASQERRPLLLFLLLGPALLIAHLVVGNTKPYQWYLIPMLPNLFLLWAAAWPESKDRFRQLLTALVLLTLAGVHALALPTARLLTRFPIEACRESVALTRGITNPRHQDYGSDSITAGPGMTTEAYDPAVIRIDSPDHLRTLMAQSRQQKKPLFLNFGYRPLLQQAHPGIFEIIDDPALFEPVQLFHGQFLSTTREVHRLR